MLLQGGKPCEAAMRRQRVTLGELRAAVRAAGQASLEGVDAVVLETDGNFSVIVSDWNGSRSALADVDGAA